MAFGHRKKLGNDVLSITFRNVPLENVKKIKYLHSRNCGVTITPPVLIEDHTMHFTPVLNLWC